MTPEKKAYRKTLRQLCESVEKYERLIRVSEEEAPPSQWRPRPAGQSHRTPIARELSWCEQLNDCLRWQLTSLQSLRLNNYFGVRRFAPLESLLGL